jgi:hypothetical protein
MQYDHIAQLKTVKLENRRDVVKPLVKKITKVAEAGEPKASLQKTEAVKRTVPKASTGDTSVASVSRPAEPDTTATRRLKQPSVRNLPTVPETSVSGADNVENKNSQPEKSGQKVKSVSPAIVAKSKVRKRKIRKKHRKARRRTASAKRFIHRAKSRHYTASRKSKSKYMAKRKRHPRGRKTLIRARVRNGTIVWHYSALKSHHGKKYHHGHRKKYRLVHRVKRRKTVDRDMFYTGQRIRVPQQHMRHRGVGRLFGHR